MLADASWRLIIEEDRNLPPAQSKLARGSWVSRGDAAPHPSSITPYLGHCHSIVHIVVLVEDVDYSTYLNS